MTDATFLAMCKAHGLQQSVPIRKHSPHGELCVRRLRFGVPSKSVRPEPF